MGYGESVPQLLQLWNGLSVTHGQNSLNILMKYLLVMRLLEMQQE